jgi:hypothetical protein
MNSPIIFGLKMRLNQPIPPRNRPTMIAAIISAFLALANGFGRHL